VSAYMHDVCPSRAWKGGQEKISLRLFHGELAGRMDLEQAGRSAGYLYEGLSYDLCGRMFRKSPREAIPLVMILRLKLGLLAICSLIALRGTCYAQNSANIPSAVVKVDSLAVYPDMNTTGRIVLSLKKGEQVVIDFEIKATEHWCGVRRPLQTSRLGYVQCQGLERIEHHTDSPTHAGGAPMSADDSKQAGHHISLPPPAAGSINGYNQIAELAVREGSIDAAKMAEFDAGAQNGSASGMSRAALAHFAAGKFELSRNSVDEAIEQFQFSLNFSAGRADLQLANLLSLAYIDLVQSKYSAALEYLERAHRLAPKSAAVAQLSGWGYYGLNQIDEAIKEWETAQSIQPSQQLAAMIEKAERDKTAESEAREANSGHFNLRYQGEATPQLAAEILSSLEAHFRSIQSVLRFTPAEPIGVVLYTQQAFRDITQAPTWAAAGNDGRIRVPVQGLTSVSDQLSSELKHELVHSFVWQKTRGRCPGWLNEGLAQWMEGRRSDRDAAGLIAAYEQGQYIPLKNLEGSWTRLPAPAARFAYAWSLAAVESIIATSGTWGIERLFDRFDVDPSFEAAMRASIQTSYADLERQTVTYLRQTYP
jgi:tetratricopeptide (TPR) repeat protein